MSFILKALKKLEDEKTVRTGQPVEINSAILASDGGVSLRPRRKWGWVTVPLALLACAALAYLFMHKSPQRIAEQRKYESPPAQAAPARPPVPPAAAAPAAPPSPPADAGREPVREMARSAAVPREPLPRHVEAREGRRERERTGESTPSSAEPVRRAGGAPSGFAVSGIAYQDNPAESMAVVNGVIVKTGMMVAGARVERIFMDRVRFRGDGGSFEVPLAR
ncbi:MAG TPA: hypothetical protein VF795_04730 [Desulfuromonadaceae bacterium]